ncbi:MAG: cell division protein FtsQ [Desulfuromonas sp.]|nr:MAG: cell division protein FtsQ [Desulfuromonas sp.]
MRDLKGHKKRRIKGNRRIGSKKKRDWKGIFHRSLRLLLFSCSTVLILSGATLAAQILFESGYFGVEQVKILNLKRLEADEIIAESNISSGDNIFRLDLEAIGRKIEENPWVAKAEVGRVFPREIVIRITEREARAIINLGYLYYVDGNAEIFKVLAADDRLDYPVITGIERSYLLDFPENGKKLLQEAMAIIDRLAERTTFTLDQVSEVHVDRENGVILTTYRSGVPVQLGFRQYDRKLDRLERIYPELEPKLPMLKGIDLNVSDRVIVKIDQKFTSGKG